VKPDSPNGTLAARCCILKELVSKAESNSINANLRTCLQQLYRRSGPHCDYIPSISVISHDL